MTPSAKKQAFHFDQHDRMHSNEATLMLSIPATQVMRREEKLNINGTPIQIAAAARRARLLPP